MKVNAKGEEGGRGERETEERKKKTLLCLKTVNGCHTDVFFFFEVLLSTIGQ